MAKSESSNVRVVVSVVAVPVLVLLLLWVNGFLTFTPDPQAYYEQLVELRDQFQDLRSRSASDSEWSEFVDQAEPVRADIVAALEPSHVSNTETDEGRACRELMFAAKEHFKPMVTDARSEPNSSEENFNEHLEAARLIMAGEPIPEKAPPGSVVDTGGANMQPVVGNTTAASYGTAGLNRNASSGSSSSTSSTPQGSSSPSGRTQSAARNTGSTKAKEEEPANPLEDTRIFGEIAGPPK